MIAGVVLAAGTSSRLGRPKQLLELQGKTVLQHVVDAAGSAGLDEVLVVLGHLADEVRGSLSLPARARVVVNADYAAGQSTSLRAGLAALEDSPAEAAVVLLGDQPLVREEAIRAVAQAFRETGASVVRARYGARIGHPILLARRVWRSARELQGDVGARGLIGELADVEPQRVQDVELAGPAPEDIDTPEQYERLRQARS